MVWREASCVMKSFCKILKYYILIVGARGTSLHKGCLFSRIKILVIQLYIFFYGELDFIENKFFFKVKHTKMNVSQKNIYLIYNHRIISLLLTIDLKSNDCTIWSKKISFHLVAPIQKLIFFQTGFYILFYIKRQHIRTIINNFPNTVHLVSWTKSFSQPCRGKNLFFH